MESLATNQETLESILDFIDEGLVEIEVLTLAPSELEDETLDCERQGQQSCSV